MKYFKIFENYNNPLNGNFYKWFGNSKVLDSDKNPLIVYHGTAKEFDKFDINKFSTRTDDGFFGKGFYFGSKNDAKRYAKNVVDYKALDGHVGAYYLKIEKPLIIIDDVEGKEDLNVDLIDLRFDDVTAFEKKLRENYDGVIFETTLSYSGKIDYQYMVINPNQIKSVNNNGSYDSDDDNTKS